MRGWFLLILMMFSGLAAAEFTPKPFSLRCGAEACPPQVGILVFGKERNAEETEIHGCTAFLMADRAVMSNSHCNKFGEMDGYFIALVNGKKVSRKITGVNFEQHTEGFEEDGKKYHSVRPDLVIFSLESSIPGVAPLKLAQGEGSVFGMVEIWGSSGPIGWDNVIKRQVCEVRRHGVYHPFSAADNPDVIGYFNCRLGHGNSGGPGFALGGSEVEIVHFGEHDPEVLKKAIKRQLLRDPFEHERHWSFSGNNARCISFEGHPGASCVLNTPYLAGAGMNREIGRLTESLKSRRVDYEGYPYQLRMTLAGETEFEAFYKPACRKDLDPAEVTFYFEHIAIVSDRWAGLSLATRSMAAVRAKVESRSGDRFVLNVDWPAPPRKFMQDNVDVRTRWGKRFSFELRLCAGYPR